MVGATYILEYPEAIEQERSSRRGAHALHSLKSMDGLRKASTPLI